MDSLTRKKRKRRKQREQRGFFYKKKTQFLDRRQDQDANERLVELAMVIYLAGNAEKRKELLTAARKDLTPAEYDALLIDLDILAGFLTAVEMPCSATPILSKPLIPTCRN